VCRFVKIYSVEGPDPVGLYVGALFCVPACLHFFSSLLYIDEIKIGLLLLASVQTSFVKIILQYCICIILQLVNKHDKTNVMYSRTPAGGRFEYFVF
jgi:hypothetical protein